MSDGAGLTSFVYDALSDALSRRVLTTRANGTTTTRTYEIDNDVASVSHLFPGGGTADFSYAYDAVHNRTLMSTSNPQLVFDPLAPVEANYSNNEMNQVESVVFEPQGQAQGIGYSLGVDLNGNLGNGLDPNGYPHDVENRLTSASTPHDSISYSYDAFGVRTSKTVDGVVTRYILDGAQVIAEEDGSGQLLRRYVYAGLDQPIRMTTPSASYFYHTDGLGSVVALSDAGGGLVETYALGPYGQIDQPSALGNPYLFTGREYDSETGLYYYRQRYYDPELGRFLEPDPVGFGDGLNLYAYVGGNPVNFVDPLGLFQTTQSGDMGIPPEFTGAIQHWLSGFRDFVADNGGVGTLTVSGALNNKAGIGVAVSLTSDPRFERFTVDTVIGQGIGCGVVGTVGRAFGSSPGDVGITVIGTTSTNRIPGVPEASVFGSLRLGEVSVSAAGGRGLGEGTGVVVGVSLPPFTITREQLGALQSR